MNLFAKIFLGFWLSTVAIIAAWVIAGQAFMPFDQALSPPALTTPDRAERPFPDPRDPRHSRPKGKDRRSPAFEELGPGPREIYRIYYGLQNIEKDRLQGWILQHEREENLDIRLIASDGKEIFGRKLLPGTDKAIERLEGFRRRVLHRHEDRVLFGQEFYRPEWGQLKLIISARPPTHPVIRFLTEHLWFRLLLAVVISGAISYAVSRYLTRPLKKLQVASRELAEGNLAARITVPDAGGDETSELARDFNSMAAQLQEKIQAQKRLLSDVSHELRSPLARMRVALALAEKEPARSAEQLQRIETEAERLDSLIGQLLTAPDTHMDMEDSLDLVALLRQVCEDAEFEARAQGKGLVLEASPADAVIRSHADLLKKALENVVRNAVHYTHPSTEVRVNLRQERQVWAITVDDQGPGVPAGQAEKIFEPFYRIDEARQRETGGFGLGLSIARRAVEQHGGTITAVNRGGDAKPHGLRINITLPLSTD